MWYSRHDAKPARPHLSQVTGVGGVEELLWGATVADQSVLVGGAGDSIQSSADHSFLGGGSDNTIGPNASYSVIPGGQDNSVGSGANNAFAAGRQAQANHPGTFVWADSQSMTVFASTTNDQVSFRCQGGVRFTSGSTNANQMVAWTPGSSSWSFTSDRNTKENVVPVDARSIADKIAALPMTEWNYIGYPQKHIGPMAQDFHAAFPWSGDDKTINSADETGVALAAIKALNAEVSGQKSEVNGQKTEIESLKMKNAELKAKLDAVMARLDAMEQR